MFDRKYMALILVSVTVITVILVVATTTSLIYAQSQTKYKAKLVGVSVVPPVNTTAAGRAVIFIDNDWLWWKLNVTGITDPTMAHIHMGKKGVNGPIIADLLKSANFENENTTGRMIITGNISASDLQGPMKGKNFTDIESAIKLHKAIGLHIDLHTNSYPEGELRGPIKIQNGSATTPITNGSATTPITNGSATTPITNGSATTPITNGSDTTPITNGSDTTPITNGSDTTPITKMAG